VSAVDLLADVDFDVGGFGLKGGLFGLYACGVRDWRV
jgi:hypothetical protein